MKKVIWKYPMGQRGQEIIHDMPECAEFLSIQVQEYTPVAWFLTRKEEIKMVKRKFRIYGTGQDIPMRERYLGTFQQPPFVWHLFEELQ